MGRKKGALLVILAVAAVVIFVVAINIDTWRNRTNPSLTNEGPVNGPMQARPPA